MDNLKESYQRALQWIHSIGRFGIKPGLERMSAMLERLGNPQNTLKFLHIGGTNGKGSTAAMTASVLQAAGYSVGLYTSPYLLSFTNRMAVNNGDVSAAELVELVDKVRPLVHEIAADPDLGQPTEFEVVTVLAMLYFARCRPDIVVLEVGLGGRLDATNVVNPLLSIITNISLEHTEILGDTIPAIAREKAGIVKPGAPLLTATEDPEALQVMEERCIQTGSTLYRVLPLYEMKEPGDALYDGFQAQFKTAYYVRRDVSLDGQTLDYRGFNRRISDLFIPLRGAYQVANAATALAALEILEEEGFTVGEVELRRGMAETRWPGRMELLSREPLLIMDGAHNPAAVSQLAAALPEYFTYNRLILVMGVMADKDVKAILLALVPLAAEVVFTRPSLPRAAEPRQLADFLEQTISFPGRVHLVENMGDALEKALSLAFPQDAVVVTGSLYTVSDARAYWENRGKG